MKFMIYLDPKSKMRDIVSMLCDFDCVPRKFGYTENGKQRTALVETHRDLLDCNFSAYPIFMSLEDLEE